MRVKKWAMTLDDDGPKLKIDWEPIAGAGEIIGLTADRYLDVRENSNAIHHMFHRSGGANTFRLGLAKRSKGKSAHIVRWRGNPVSMAGADLDGAMKLFDMLYELFPKQAAVPRGEHLGKVTSGSRVRLETPIDDETCPAGTELPAIILLRLIRRKRVKV